MLIPILVSGLILGLLIRFALKFLNDSYGFSNDMDNRPAALLKACRHCNRRIAREYQKNLCPHCGKPLE